MRSRKGLAKGLVGGFIAGALVFSAVGAWAVDTHEGKPFDGVLEGDSTSTVAGGVITTVSAGTFHANHMGHGTYTLTAEQDYPRHANNDEPNRPDLDCAFIEDGPGPGIILRAANGDEVHGNIDDDRSVTCVSQETPGPGPDQEYISTLYVQIEGGTGRFTDATGYFFARSTSTFAGGDIMEADFDDAGVFMGDIDY